MSGDSFGVLVGGALILGALPVVAGAALASGAAYATYKVAQTGYRVYRKNRLNASQNASPTLRTAVQSLQNRMDRQTEQADLARARHIEAVRRQGAQLRDAASSRRPDPQAMAAAREAVDREMRAESLRQERETLRREAMKDMADILAASQQAYRLRRELADWAAQDERNRQIQNRLTAESIMDARETLTLLQDAAKSGDDQFVRSAEEIERQVRESEQAFLNGNLQNACVQAQYAVVSGLTLISEHADRQFEEDELRADLLTRMEGLQAELGACRSFRFIDPNTGRPEEANLAEYSQGLWDSTSDDLQRAIETARHANRSELDALEYHFEQDLHPAARRMMESSSQQMLSYYQKLYTAETIISAMHDNNFHCQSAVQPQDDKTQELALLFTDPTGAQLVVSLDSDAAQDMDSIRLGMHVVPGEGVQPSEQELDSLRSYLTESLSGDGVEAELHCSGQVNRPTALPQYANLELLRAEPARVRTEN
ncbi:MAG: hypothetical protein IJE08_01280 [Clostridia bacterium]|nr:hypothetical protein [Clostridia bacterium]